MEFTRVLYYKGTYLGMHQYVDVQDEVPYIVLHISDEKLKVPPERIFIKD